MAQIVAATICGICQWPAAAASTWAGSISNLTEIGAANSSV